MPGFQYAAQHHMKIAGKACECDEAWRFLADPDFADWCKEPLARGDYTGYLFRRPRPLCAQAFQEMRREAIAPGRRASRGATAEEGQAGMELEVQPK